ncbi:hypothetical protein BST65_35195 [Bradyrhizobium canariense]|nr:hypothetical protein BST65_35195 [Bradyrhizobium canariense]OSI26148.1 hypothetical protein BST66_37960 [Bradyrhizobium canariense]OSI37661.1 hypothetical protein BSZ20_37990 [Bradyrhizobium canariense]OSI42409.1 hypothetical protein BST67_37340 [Bradyrhizobium canariense]OSI57286.1 hypothetical protein BSZ15_14465 [Bradyrhizobium canariense]
MPLTHSITLKQQSKAMHGTFNDLYTRPAFDIADFSAFIASLYDSGSIPALHVINDEDVTTEEYFKQTGCVPVLSEDETERCPLFGDWGAYYAFEGWLAYRAMHKSGNEFQLMVTDVLNAKPWSAETSQWISMIHALVTVQELYADKFKNYPLDIEQFVNACIRYGQETVLHADIY